MTVGSGTTITIDTDDTSTLDNQGTIIIEEDAVINIGSESSSLALLSNGGTISGPGQINIFGFFIDVQNSEVITAIINQFLTEGPLIGGEVIPVDTTALLMAGAQNSMIWWLPAVVIVGASIAFLKAKRRVKVNE